MTASKYLITPRQSQPRERLLAQLPAPPSPKSNACLRWKGGRASAYGTDISEMLIRYMMLLPSYLTSCRTAPSRGLNDTLKLHFCHSTSDSSVTLKEGPSGCVMLIGFTSCRRPPSTISGTYSAPSQWSRTRSECV
ncbi:hypothetical protein IG631_11845 [Alternaria alternata]|nr:hypothetical protein IG631_11845 [Alternaria alternata]